MTTLRSPLTLRFTVPYPPLAVLPNSRAHWAAKASAATKYGLEAGGAVMAYCAQQDLQLPMAYRHGRLATTHHFTRQAADPDNCVGALKPLIDILQMANKGSGVRFRLGIIENDRNLQVSEPVRRPRSPLGKVIECVLEVW